MLLKIRTLNGLGSRGEERIEEKLINGPVTEGAEGKKSTDVVKDR